MSKNISSSLSSRNTSKSSSSNSNSSSLNSNSSLKNSNLSNSSSSSTSNSISNSNYIIDIIFGLFIIILIPFINKLYNHNLSLEFTSIIIFIFSLIIFTRLYLTTATSSTSSTSSTTSSTTKKKSFFSILTNSIFISGFFYLFGPVILEYTPPILLEPFVKFPYGNNLSPDIGNQNYMNVITYENITLKEAHEIVSKTNVPVLFRNIIKNSKSIGNEALLRLESSNKKYLSQRFKTRPYDFFRGSKFEASLESSVSDVLKNYNNEYIGFEPLLTKEETASLMGNEYMNKVVVDHSFISNFNETIVTTFVHAAPASMSWSVQLIGKKTWFLWDPSLYKPLNMGWFCRVSVPSYGDEKLLFSFPSYRVTVDEGDILVFPPMWYHTVVTHSKLNFMITIRTTCGNWSPNLIPSIRFWTANVLTKWVGQSTPHHQPGIRKIRMKNLQEVFELSPESMRWDNPELYLEKN